MLHDDQRTGLEKFPDRLAMVAKQIVPFSLKLAESLGHTHAEVAVTCMRIEFAKGTSFSMMQAPIWSIA